MNKRIYKGCRVLVPAIVDSFNLDRYGKVVDVEDFFERKLVTVKYDAPDRMGKAITVVWEHQVERVK